MALVGLAKVVEADEGQEDVLRTATAAAIDEARYRRSRNEGPVSSSGGSIHDLEQIERRQHALKRFISSVLWLDVEIRDGYTVALHVFRALAAGIAMAFVWSSPFSSVSRTCRVVSVCGRRSWWWRTWVRTA